MDGDVKITQSVAIMKYLGHRYNLLPKNEDEQVRADLIESEGIDMRFKFGMTCYNPNFVSKSHSQFVNYRQLYLIIFF